MRFSLLSPTAFGLVAMTLGCAQVAGIEDISASVQAQSCVDTVNMLRAAASLPAVTRWLNEEQCADQTADISATGGQLPACTAGLPLFSEAESGAIDPDTFLQRAVNDQWGASGHGTLGDMALKEVACGYSTASGNTGAALLYEE